jgi:hypothetical protein
MSELSLEQLVRGWCYDVVRIRSELDVEPELEEERDTWGLDDWYFALQRRVEIASRLQVAAEPDGPELQCADALLQTFTREVPASWATARGFNLTDPHASTWWTLVPERGPVLRDYVRQGEELEP